MRVSLDTYGGLAGGTGGAPVVVDTDKLSEEARNELRRLISAAAAAAAVTSRNWRLLTRCVMRRPTR